MSGRTYSARVMTFRASVYRHRRIITPGCQLLLLRLSDSMSADAKVSVPRTRLARDLACPEPRITEWMKEAREAGFLSIIEAGRPGRTSTYQGLNVEKGTPRRTSQGYGSPDPYGVRPGVPLQGPQGYATHPTQVVTPEPHVAQRLRVVGSDDAGSDGRSVS